MIFIGLQFVLGWSLSNLRKGDFHHHHHLTTAPKQSPQTQNREKPGTHEYTPVIWQRSGTSMLVKGERSTPNQTSSVGLVVCFLGWDDTSCRLFNSMSAVKTAAGRMPSQFSVSLTSQRALRHSHWCVKKPALFFAFCHVSLSFADEASAFPEVFSMTREHPPEVSSHRRMRSLEIIMAGRPPWTWVLSNTKDGAEQWETFFCGGLWYSTDRYLAYLSSKHTFVPAIFEYIYMHVMCVWLVFLLCMQF